MEERAYHGMTRALVLNEIFRRVEPSGRTMAEFLRDEFPDIDVRAGMTSDEQEQVVDLRT